MENSEKSVKVEQNLTEKDISQDIMLLTEDNSFFESISADVENAGYKLTLIQKFNEAFKFLDVHDNVAMIIDLAFSNGKAGAFAKSIMEEDENIKIIFVTDKEHSTPGDLPEGCYHFHVKPVSSKDIIDSLKNKGKMESYVPSDNIAESYQHLVETIEREEDLKSQYEKEINKLKTQLLEKDIKKQAVGGEISKLKNEIKELQKDNTHLKNKLNEYEQKIEILESEENNPLELNGDDKLFIQTHILFRKAASGNIDMELARDLVRRIVKKTEILPERFIKYSFMKTLIASLAMHSLNTAGLSAIISKEFGEGNPGDVAMAALLHDVGKLKTTGDNLTSESHLQESIDIIKEYVECSKIVQAIGEHHERIDGKGFPGGLKRDEIDTLARILAVANSLEKKLSPMTIDHIPEFDKILSKLIDETREGHFDARIIKTVAEICARQGIK